MIAPIKTNILDTLKLTERQIALGLADGLSDKEIARKFNISTLETVRYHKQAMFRRLGLNNRVKIAILVDRELRAGASP